MAAPEVEARITTANNVLVMLSAFSNDDVAQRFCGSVVDDLANIGDVSGKTVYLCGDLEKARDIEGELNQASRVFIVGDLATNESAGETGAWPTIDAGMVPLLWHGVGVYYRGFFDAGTDYFNAVEAEHTFQSLTESTKAGKAHRTGLYLTPVEQIGDDLHFRLLRCSTNLTGPTEGFGATDTGIVDALNTEARAIFDNPAPLNHVLAQMYPNAAATDTQKQTKAAISSHADKTKDMPADGIMAFCTFYDQLETLQPLADDEFDYGHKSTSGMTRLEFRLKESARQEAGGELSERFTVVLYPNSVFFMPLSTNRLYTHAIRPSALDASQLPTRLGYVVRCSETEAVHRHGTTFLKEDDALVELVPATAEGIDELRQLYTEENKTTNRVDYAGRFYFSMNSGDYAAPDIA